MNNAQLERKLELVKAEIGSLSYKTIAFINTGCEKDVLILDNKTVVLFYRDGLQIDSYRVIQKLIRRINQDNEAALPVCLYLSQKVIL